MPNSWKLLITEDNIGDYVDGTAIQEFTQTFSIQDATMDGHWHPLGDCPYLHWGILGPGMGFAGLGNMTAMHNAWYLGIDNTLHPVSWTKGTGITYTGSTALTTDIWFPAVTDQMNASALANPFTGENDWKITTAEANMSIPIQTIGNNNLQISAKFHVVWAKFAWDNASSPTGRPPLVYDESLTSYEDLVLCDKVTLLDPTEMTYTNFASLGNIVLTPPPNMHTTAVETGPTNIAPDSGYTLASNEKLIPILFWKPIVCNAYSTGEYAVTEIVGGYGDLGMGNNTGFSGATYQGVDFDIALTVETVLS